MVSKEWLYNNAMAKIGKLTGYHVVYTPGRTKNGIKIGKVSEKCDILTVEEKRIALIRNNTKNKPFKWQQSK